MWLQGWRDNTLIFEFLFVAGINGLWNDLNGIAKQVHRSDVIPLLPLYVIENGILLKTNHFLREKQVILHKKNCPFKVGKGNCKQNPIFLESDNSIF